MTVDRLRTVSWSNVNSIQPVWLNWLTGPKPNRGRKHRDIILQKILLNRYIKLFNFVTRQGHRKPKRVISPQAFGSFLILPKFLKISKTRKPHRISYVYVSNKLHKTTASKQQNTKIQIETSTKMYTHF